MTDLLGEQLERLLNGEAASSSLTFEDARYVLDDGDGWQPPCRGPSVDPDARFVAGSTSTNDDAEHLMERAIALLEERRPTVFFELDDDLYVRVLAALVRILDEDRAARRRMFEHQHTGALFMLLANELSDDGFILADQMGLGKTLTYCNFVRLSMQLGRKYDGSSRFLVLVPASMVSTWKVALKAWVNHHLCTVDDLKYIRSSEKNGGSIVGPKAKVVLVTIEALKKRETASWMTYDDGEKEDDPPLPVVRQKRRRRAAGQPQTMPRPVRKKVNWFHIALDEAHCIKDEQTATYKHFAELSANSVLLMTGTPMINAPHELITLLNVAGAGTDLRVGSNPSEEAMDELAHLVKQFVLRRTIADVDPTELSIPNVEYVPIHVTLKRLHQRVLDVVSDLAMSPILLRHTERQACITPNIIYDRKLSQVQKSRLPGRAELVREGNAVIETLVGDVQSRRDAVSASSGGGSPHPPGPWKAIIFTHYKSHVAAVMTAMDSINLIAYELTGDLNDRKKEVNISGFKNTSSDCILVANITCGGTGLNLQEASVVYFLMPDYTSANELQAVSRIARCGQLAKKVTAVFINVDYSCTERALRIQYDKLKTEIKVMGGCTLTDRHRNRFDDMEMDSEDMDSEDMDSE